MWLNTSGSDGGGSLRRGAESRGADSAPVVAEEDEGTGPGLSPPPPLAGVRGFAAPPTRWLWAHSPHLPPVRRLTLRGPGVVGPQGGGGASAQHSRWSRAPAGRRRARARAGLAGQARPSQEDNAAAPARRASGTSTWRPGATQGRALGQLGPAEEPVWPSWLARQQRPMPQPRLLHRAQDGAPCPKQSAPCVPLPVSEGGCAVERRAGRFR